MNRSLFEISDDLYALSDLLHEVDGDVGNAEAAIDEWLLQLGEERDAKLDNYARLIASLKAEADAVKEEISRLKERQRLKERAAERLSSRLESFFRAHQIDQIKTDLHTFKMQLPGGKPKVILQAYFEDNPIDLPEGMRRVKFEADLVAIRQRLEEGDEDVQRYATLATVDPQLRIK